MTDKIKQAGRKRSGKDEAIKQKRHQEALLMYETQKEYLSDRRKFERDVFLTALSGVIQNGQWQYNGKHASGIPEHIAIAKDFAKQAVREMMP